MGNSPIHGLKHWTSVLENGRKLAAETGANLKVVELFSVLHDARRENENDDPEHGHRAAALARECNGDWFDLNVIDGVVNGIANLSQLFSGRVRKINSGFTGHYASLTVGGLGAIVLLTRIIMPVMGWSL